MQLKGIDVSVWQNNIDWAQVKASGIEFAMVRLGYAQTLDKKFKINVQNAVNAGVNVGVYLYSYATSVSEAKKEAEFVLSVIKDYSILYPVAFDLEDKSQENLGKRLITDIAVAFCSVIESAGYYTMLYCNADWLRNRIDYNRIKNYDIWVAQWTSKLTYENPCGIWQYSSTGTIPGISGDVDLNISYKDYPNLIKAAGLNGISSNNNSTTDSWENIIRNTVNRPDDWITKLNQLIEEGKENNSIEQYIPDLITKLYNA